MAISFGYTDSSKTPLSVSVPNLTYASDFSVRDEKSTEIIITNTTSPLDQPETIRFAWQTVGNVYNNTDIATENQAITRRGLQLLTQVNDIIRVTPDSESGHCDCAYDLPISAHLVLRVPLNNNVTADTVMQVALRCVATLFDGSNSTSRLNSMLRGSLKPKDM